MAETTIDLTLVAVPPDCNKASGSQVTGQEALDRTLFPGDTIRWELAGNGSVSASLQGLEITGQTVGGDPVSLAPYVEGSPPGSLTTACGTVDFEFAGNGLSVRRQLASHDPITIDYNVWFETDGALPTTFFVSGTLILARVLAIPLLPASAADPPTIPCCSCGADVAQPLPDFVTADTAIVWFWDSVASPWSGTTELRGVHVIDHVEEIVEQGGLVIDPTPEPLAELFTAPQGTITAPGSNPCTEVAPGRVVYDPALGNSYPSVDVGGVPIVQFDVGPLDHLRAFPGSLDDRITLTYVLWFTHTPTGGSPLWWAFEPDMVMEREGDTGPLIGRGELGRLRMCPGGAPTTTRSEEDETLDYGPEGV